MNVPNNGWFMLIPTFTINKLNHLKNRLKNTRVYWNLLSTSKKPQTKWCHFAPLDERFDWLTNPGNMWFHFWQHLLEMVAGNALPFWNRLLKIQRASCTTGSVCFYLWFSFTRSICQSSRAETTSVPHCVQAWAYAQVTAPFVAQNCAPLSGGFCKRRGAVCAADPAVPCHTLQRPKENPLSKKKLSTPKNGRQKGSKSQIFQRLLKGNAVISNGFVFFAF